MNEQPTGSRELQIPKLLDELLEHLDSLEKSINSLSNRLSKVSRPEIEAHPSAMEGKAPSPLCEFAENIASKILQVRHLEGVVQLLESRLEI